jgi:hypothetical protein
MVIQLFKDKADVIEIEIDLKNGVKHNKLLERRALERQLNLLPPGAPAQLKKMKKLAELEGDMSLADSDFFGQPQEEGGMPQAPATGGQLSAQLTQ